MATTSAGTKEVEGAGKAGSLKQTEVRDTLDTSPRAKGDTTGQRVRAIFWGGGTTCEIPSEDFKRHGITHPTVRFDFRKDDATLPVNPRQGIPGLTKEAADFLTMEFPLQFEYMDRG